MVAWLEKKADQPPHIFIWGYKIEPQCKPKYGKDADLLPYEGTPIPEKLGAMKFIGKMSLKGEECGLEFFCVNRKCPLPKISSKAPLRRGEAFLGACVGSRANFLLWMLLFFDFCDGTDFLFTAAFMISDAL